MTNPITQFRADVAADLAELGITTYDFIPESMVAPAAVITPGSPYVVPGQVLAEVEVTLNVRVYSGAGTNEAVTQALDELIVNVLNALRSYGTPSVGQPGIDRSYQQPYLVADITISSNYSNGGN